MQESLSQYSPGQLSRYKAMSIALALITALIGGAALLGWIIGSEILKRVHPALVTMKANTSVCLILISCSFFLLRDPKAANWQRRAGQVCAVLVGLMGLLTLSEHIAGWDLHIDQLLFEESVAEAGLSFPGRMGVAASLNFFFLGVALFTLGARKQRWFRVSIVSVLLVVAITVLAFLYYFYGIEIEDTVPMRFTIALHTVVAFLSLCAAILLARPDRGVVAIVLGNTPGGMVARRLWPILLIVVLLGWFRTIGHSSGLFGAGFANALFVLSVLLILVILICWTAISLNRTDRERTRVEKRLDVLVRVSELIRTIRDPYELSYQVAQIVGVELDLRRCLFNETDVKNDLEIVHRDYCNRAESVAGVHRISDYSSITSELMKRGETVVNNDSRTDPRTAADYARSYEPNGERSYVAFPLLREGQWVASLWASDDEPRQWTKEEVTLIQSVGERTWTAIEKLRAEQERERLLKSEQEARDVAERANRLKDEFLATLSHELRNPLNVILGYSELLLRMPEIEESERLRRMAEALRRNAQSQSQLINDLLDLSRLQRGKISLNHEIVSLAAIIDHAVETVRAEATAKGVEINLHLGDHLLLVDGDRLRLQQIAWNLLNNAVKFTPAGGWINVSLSCDDTAAMLLVEDTGQGIDPGFLPHVFEMFRQADSSNSRRHGGMGIGLALVRQLVQLHGGTVAAESAGTDKGSRFTIRLPLTSEHLLSAVSASTPLKLKSLAQKDFLIVDDSEDTIAMLDQLLKISGANVTSATNGADALRLASEREFDVVLSDISMPEMDGFEFLQRLRKIAGREQIPVIAITGFGRPDDVERIRAAGFFSHLTKPLNLDTLAGVLDQLANRAASQSSSRAPRNNGSPASEV
jgi:signal transduction histidine kinase/ActR/RegA family two-component response regulator